MLRPSHSSWLDYSNYTSRRVQVTKLLLHMLLNCYSTLVYNLCVRNIDNKFTKKQAIKQHFPSHFFLSRIFLFVSSLFCFCCYFHDSKETKSKFLIFNLNGGHALLHITVLRTTKNKQYSNMNTGLCRNTSRGIQAKAKGQISDDGSMSRNTL
jgi:hypothetical protein